MEKEINRNVRKTLGVSWEFLLFYVDLIVRKLYVISVVKRCSIYIGLFTFIR